MSIISHQVHECFRPLLKFISNILHNFTHALKFPYLEISHECMNIYAIYSRNVSLYTATFALLQIYILPHACKSVPSSQRHLPPRQQII